MASPNKCMFIGNLNRDPDARYMPNGEAVTNCSIACNEVYKDKSGAKQEKVEFVNLVFYRKLAEIAAEYLKKGSQIYVEGRLQTRKWTDKEGNEKYTTEIIADQMQMLSKRTEGSSAYSFGDGEKTPSKPVEDFEFDEDLPF